MALSDYEKKMLEQLEAQLTNDDPNFADNMNPAPEQVEAITRQISVRNLVLGLLITVVGVGVLIGGVSQSNLWWIGIAGVLVMMYGVWFILVGIRTKTVTIDASEAAKPSSGGVFGDFMNKQTEKLDKYRRRFGK
ncbi:DUF3040 domain-containing protein [Actinotignum urinale]|uniref:DUF3040 domain-containing protein n=1 Tax=Actinotignum urinale TaxID=190146 RepID=UPI002A8338F2|nr:DUF3040 domain-containing protein [Actinotignum urinale]MDY5129134.1 DUF3040 domain-containing protein [Actinotignum urinale]